ncbi:MAG: MFS transporter [Candidatus Pacearchaeota archaeon]|nr:MFS transporter [Candidatus Pacearchaeota archaeon]
MNKTLKLLIASDAFLWAGLGLVSPILAIYIKDYLPGGSITVVGVASMVFLLTKVTLQLIFSKIFQPEDRFWMVVFGTFLIATVPFIYLVAKNIWQFFLAQLIYGFGAGLSFPAWFSLFASNLTKGKQGYEWSIYSAWVGISSGVSAYVGSWLANFFGFEFVFFLVGIFALTSASILLTLQKEGLKKKAKHEMFVGRH